MRCCTYRRKKFTYYYGFSSCSYARFCSGTSFVLVLNTQSQGLVVATSLTLSLSVIIVANSGCSHFSFIRYKFDICMQLKFDDSSCGNPFGTKMDEKKIQLFRTSKHANESARTELSIFFVSYSNEMRGSEFCNFIFKRSAID